MNTYVVKYLDGTDLKVAFVQGGNQTEAGREFKKLKPEISDDKIIDVENINIYTENDYSQAIGLAKFISFIGWIIIVIAILAVIITIGESKGGPGLLVVLPFLSAIPIGLLLIVFGQSSRASMDSANTSRQILLHNLAKSNK